MKKLLTLLVLSSTAMLGFAQTAGKITGNIKDGGNQKIIDAATISLLKATDSSLVKTSLTDKEGLFAFENIKPGTYLVMATSIGHTKLYSTPIILTDVSSAVSIGTLQLVPVNKTMAEVVVVAKKPFIERKIDKTIINPDALISNTGSTAIEVLEKAPGVTVDKDGNISLIGKSGVVVMLDGKPTYMSNQDLVNFLRSMPSSNIDQIELMSNPSAKYDASGNSGIINIKTKKQKQKGFNGSLAVAYGQGFYPKTNNSINLNYRRGKVNLFSTLSANYRKGYQNLDIKRIYLNNDETVKAIFEQNSLISRNRKNFNAKLGMDFYASKKTTLGIVLTGYTTPGTEGIANTSFLKNSSMVLDSIVTAKNMEKSTWKSGAININARHTFDSTGRELTADLDFVNYSANKNQSFLNNSYQADWVKKSNDELAGELPSDINIYSAKLDYTQPLKSGIKMDAGLKISYVNTDNTAGYFNIINGSKEVDYDKTNRFQYKENINAGFVNFSKSIKNWGFQGGLRIENTQYSGKQFGNPQHVDSSFSNQYTNAFPTAYISYAANKKNEFGLSYGRRISRPDYEDLNPFLFFLDKYTYGSGNPFLKPMFSNVFELTHSYNHFLNTSLNYGVAKDMFTETFEQKDFATILRKGNYGRRENANVSVSAQLKPKKWWNMNVYTAADYQHFTGTLYGNEIDAKATTWLVNVNNQFNFKKGWAAELSGFYRSKGIEGQIEILALSQLNAGVSKQVLKNKGTLKFAVRDFTGPMKTKGNINFQNTRASFMQENDNRVATISFNYRFGKPIKGLQKRKTGGAGDEQDRIKSAN